MPDLLQVEPNQDESLGVEVEPQAFTPSKENAWGLQHDLQIFDGAEGMQQALGDEKYAKVESMLEYSSDPDVERLKFANLSYVSRQTGKDIETLSGDWEFYRNTYAATELGQKKNVSEQEIYSLIGERVKRQRDTFELVDSIPKAGAEHALRAMARGESPSKLMPLEVAEDMKENGAFDETQTDLYLELWRKGSAQVGETHAGTAKLAQELVPMFEAVVEAESGEPWRSARNNLLDRLADMEPEQADGVLAFVRLIAEQSQDGDGISTLEGMDKAFERGIVDIDSNTRAMLNETAAQKVLDSDELWIAGDASGSDEELFEAAIGDNRMKRVFGNPIVRKATDEEMEAIKRGAEKSIARTRIEAKMLQVLHGDIDPLDPDGVWQRMMFGASEMTPMLLMGIGGSALGGPGFWSTVVAGGLATMPAITGSLYEQNRQAGMSIDDAGKLSVVAGAGQAAIEGLQTATVLGRVPWINKLTKRFSPNNLVARYGVNLAGMTIAENTQEALQDVVPLLVQDVASTLSEDIPGVEWGPQLERLASSRPDVFLAMVPLTVLGAAGSTYSQQQRKALAESLGDPTASLLVGFTESEANAIASEPDLSKRLGLFQKAYDAERSKDEYEANIAKGMAVIEEGIKKVEAAGVRIEPRGNKYDVLMSGEEVRTVSNRAMAMSIANDYADAKETANAELQEVPSEFADLEQVGIGIEPMGDSFLVTLPDAKPIEVETQEAAIEFAQEYASSNALAERGPSEADQAANVEGSQEGRAVQSGGDVAGSPVSDVQGAGPVRVPLQQQPIGGAKPISAPEVIETIAKLAEAAGSSSPVRTGNMTLRKGYAGEFHVREEVARIRTANNIPTAAHEIGHAVDKALFGGKLSGQVPIPVKRELIAMGKALYGKKKPTGGYLSEGFAEYMRLYVTGGRDVAAKVAPEFAPWFAEKVAGDKKLTEALEKASQAAINFSEQGAQERGKQGIVKNGVKARVKKLLGKMNWRTVNRHWFDSAETLRRFRDDAVQRAKNDTIALKDDPYATLEARRMTADAIAGRWVEHGVTDLYGNQVGPSLNDAVKSVKGHMDAFIVYLWARRTRALANDPRGSRNSGLSVQDAKTIISEAERDHPAFKEAAQKVYEWQDATLNYAAQASADFTEIADRIREADPGAYIPLQREFQELNSRWGNLGSSTKGGSNFKRMSKEGSGRRIKNPMESMIAQATATIQNAHEKLVLDKMISLAQRVEGLGRWVTEVPRHMIPVYSASADTVIEYLQRKIADNGTLEVAVEDVDLTELMLTFFAKAEKPKAGDNPVLPVFREGKLRFYEFDAGLYEALTGMGMYRLPAALHWTFGLSARSFRLGTTGLRAAFSLVTNPLRDLRTFHVNSRAHANSGEAFLSYIGSFAESALHIASGGKYSNGYIDAFENLGGEMAQQLRQDIGHTSRAARRMFAGRVVRTLDPRNTFDFLRDILSFPESAARITELKLIAKQIGWAPGQPMSEEQATELLKAAKSVTTDFTAAGEFARVVNQLVPFFNASLQGPRAHLRAFKHHPGRFMLRGMMGTAAALALWSKNKDDEWWQEMPEKLRYLYTYVPIEIGGRKELIRIPRSFELDGLFMAMAESMADAWYRQDPEHATEWFKTFVDTSTPDLWNPLVKEAAQQLTGPGGEDYFFDRPIVSQAQTDDPAEEQYTAYTTKVAIELGQVFNASPARIDHAIRGIFGGAGADLVALLGRGPDGEAGKERESEPADIAVLGTLFVRGGDSGQGSKSIDGFYDRLEAADKLNASHVHHETKDQRHLRLQMSDARKAMAAISHVQQMALTVEERRDMQKLKVRIAKEANGAFDANEVNRALFKRWKQQAELMEKKAGPAEK